MMRVLIAHQSTIPHYRVDFYNHLKKVLPNDIYFRVVDDSQIEKRRIFFDEKIDPEKLEFDIHYTSTHFLSKKSKYSFQTFLFTSWEYDLIIVENAINNFSYFLIILLKIFGKKIAFWGHGRDFNNKNDNSMGRKLIEFIKIFLVKKSDGFFAYTESVQKYVESKNVKNNMIFNIQNTINIDHARKCFESIKKKNYDLTKNIVFTGRLNISKRIEFLLNSFEILSKKDKDFILIIIGNGTNDMLNTIDNYSKYLPIRYLGEVTNNNELAKIYRECDLYVYPGYVGLGALHAMCFDLVPVVIESKYHKPEYDYLNKKNSIILPEGTSAESYAEHILDIYKEKELLVAKKDQVWNSISSLTINNMATRFADGIKKILDA